MLRKIIIRFLYAERPLLGRWCLNDKSKNNWKIDMANIDHCGTCKFKQEKHITEKNPKKEKS